jgi:nitrogen fixation protein NifB
VKVNTILIPGVNENHVEAVAEKMAQLGVDVLNVMAMVPNAGTPFGELEEPGTEMIARVRDAAQKHLPQMKHCQRCRADAVGLLCEDRSGEFAELMGDCSEAILLPSTERPYVAVATREGLLVNQHLGETTHFQIWENAGDSFRLIDKRKAPPKGGGMERWRDMAATLSDCRAVLVSGFGDVPNAILTQAGVMPLEMGGFIEMALKAVYDGKNVSGLKKRRTGGCSKGVSCGGDGGGCG